MTFISPYFDKLREQIRNNGGLHNAHLHLDRAYTLDPSHLGSTTRGITQQSHISLKEKHGLIRALHESDAYCDEDLRSRLRLALTQLKDAGTRVADSVIDVTDDRIELSALMIAKDIAEEFADDVTFRVASYNPFGFTDAAPRRWELFEQGAEIADFIGCFPERDDHRDYPDHVGYKECCARVLDLAKRVGKFVHFHTDQRNDPHENATEKLLDIVKSEGAPSAPDGSPMVWAVHMISPSSYSEDRFQRLVDGLLEFNVGVICCPSAALGMRQIRAFSTPTHNSIARVLELIERGVHVRLGSDNIADMCSPSTTADLVDEVYVLSAALRFYDIPVLAKLASGIALDPAERDHVKEHNRQNNFEATVAHKSASSNAEA